MLKEAESFMIKVHGGAKYDEIIFHVIFVTKVLSKAFYKWLFSLCFCSTFFMCSTQTNSYFRSHDALA